MPSTPFGDHLKRERELRGVTLEEVAAATRISRASSKLLKMNNGTAFREEPSIAALYAPLRAILDSTKRIWWLNTRSRQEARMKVRRPRVTRVCRVTFDQ